MQMCLGLADNDIYLEGSERSRANMSLLFEVREQSGENHQINHV